MKNVLITGGSRGIGAAMTRLFSSEGYSVAFTYKNSESEAMRLASECGALAIRADSESEAEIKKASEVFLSELGAPYALVNNVGVSSFGLLTDTTLSEWNRIFSVNVTSAFLYSKYLLPQMINKKQGRIINISSMWGSVGSSCEVAYSASKAALIGFTKALAKEVGPSGITVNCITPGLINTDMNSHLSKEDLSALIEETPLMRMGEAIDVARGALFLLGESSSFITGEILGVNGGFVI